MAPKRPKYKGKKSNSSQGDDNKSDGSSKPSSPAGVTNLTIDIPAARASSPSKLSPPITTTPAIPLSHGSKNQIFPTSANLLGVPPNTPNTPNPTNSSPPLSTVTHSVSEDATLRKESISSKIEIESLSSLLQVIGISVSPKLDDRTGKKNTVQEDSDSSFRSLDEEALDRFSSPQRISDDFALQEPLTVFSTQSESRGKGELKSKPQSSRSYTSGSSLGPLSEGALEGFSDIESSGLKTTSQTPGPSTGTTPTPASIEWPGIDQMTPKQLAEHERWINEADTIEDLTERKAVDWRIWQPEPATTTTTVPRRKPQVFGDPTVGTPRNPVPPRTPPLERIKRVEGVVGGSRSARSGSSVPEFKFDKPAGGKGPTSIHARAVAFEDRPISSRSPDPDNRPTIPQFDSAYNDDLSAEIESGARIPSPTFHPNQPFGIGQTISQHPIVPADAQYLNTGMLEPPGFDESLPDFEPKIMDLDSHGLTTDSSIVPLRTPIIERKTRGSIVVKSSGKSPSIKSISSVVESIPEMILNPEYEGPYPEEHLPAIPPQVMWQEGLATDGTVPRPRTARDIRDARLAARRPRSETSIASEKFEETEVDEEFGIITEQGDYEPDLHQGPYDPFHPVFGSEHLHNPYEAAPQQTQLSEPPDLGLDRSQGDDPTRLGHRRRFPFESTTSDTTPNTRDGYFFPPTTSYPRRFPIDSEGSTPNRSRDGLPGGAQDNDAPKINQSTLFAHPVPRSFPIPAPGTNLPIRPIAVLGGSIPPPPRTPARTCHQRDEKQMRAAIDQANREGKGREIQAVFAELNQQNNLLDLPRKPMEVMEYKVWAKGKENDPHVALALKAMAALEKEQHEMLIINMNLETANKALQRATEIVQETLLETNVDEIKDTEIRRLRKQAQEDGLEKDKLVRANYQLTRRVKEAEFEPSPNLQKLLDQLQATIKRQEIVIQNLKAGAKRLPASVAGSENTASIRVAGENAVDKSGTPISSPGGRRLDRTDELKNQIENLMVDLLTATDEHGRDRAIIARLQQEVDGLFEEVKGVDDRIAECYDAKEELNRTIAGLRGELEGKRQFVEDIKGQHRAKKAEQIDKEEEDKTNNPWEVSINLALWRCEMALKIMVSERAQGRFAGRRDTTAALNAANDAIKLSRLAAEPDVVGRSYFWQAVVLFYRGETGEATTAFGTASEYSEWFANCREHESLNEWIEEARTIGPSMNAADYQRINESIQNSAINHGPGLTLARKKRRSNMGKERAT